MREKMKGRRVWGVLTATVLIFFLLFTAMSAVHLRTKRLAQQQHQSMIRQPQRTRNYDASKELADASERLQTEKGKAELVEKAQVSQRKISLVFSGMPSLPQMEQILKLLDEFGIKALFCIDGISAAEASDMVLTVEKQGHNLGSYGLRGEPYPQLLEEEELLESLVRTQVIFREITGKEPGIYQGNAVKYTPEMLHTVYCAGLSQAVQPSSFISNSSFPSFSAAMGYVQSLSAGEIVCVKLAGVLDEIEYEPPVKETRSAERLKSLTDETTVENMETDIVRTVEYLLQALRTTNTVVVPLERLSLDWEEMVEELSAGIYDAQAGQVKEGQKVSSDYFREALFIGDSLTQGLSQYEFPDGLKDTASFCAYRSITPEQILNNVTAENINGRKVPVLDEIISEKPERLYILLGMNCLATQSDETLLDSYRRLLKRLQEEFPAIPIYIQGLPPVTESVSQQQVTMTNGRIRNLNVELLHIADENGCYYLDLYTALCDESGNLPYFLAQDDGIHLKRDGIRRYTEFLCLHTAEDGS